MPLTISRAIDNGRSVILLLLDLSAAFDTFDLILICSHGCPRCMVPVTGFSTGSHPIFQVEVSL